MGSVWGSGVSAATSTENTLLRVNLGGTGSGLELLWVLGPSAASIDDLVGKCQEYRRHLDAESLCGLEIDHQLETGDLFNWNISRPRAIEDFLHLAGCSPEDL